MSTSHSVLIADDSAFARKVTASHLAGTEFKIVGGAATDTETVTLYKDLSPDIVLLDVVMPEKGGIEALKAIMKLNRSAKVVMLSSMGTEETVTECLQIGALGFVQKPFDKDTLLAQLRRTFIKEGENAHAS